MAPRKEKDMEEYRGYFIERNFYGHGEYSVEYCGEDVIFRTLVEAKEFIDEITEEVQE